MLLQRWNPYHELHNLDRVADRLFASFGPRPFWWPHEDGAWSIPVDAIETDQEITVKASLPGIDPKDIDVTLDGDAVTIRAEARSEQDQSKDGYLLRERRVGAFYRSLRLPDTIDRERAEVRYENGVLSVRFPKTEATKPRKLEVKAA